MTQDATTQTPLQALNKTLHERAARIVIARDEAEIAAARQSLIDDGLNPDAKIKFDENGDAPIKSEDRFYSALDRLEAEGAALLQTAETHIEDAGHTILAIGEHALHPAAAAPHRIELARALPLARAGDILHESEHAVIRAFMDVGDVLRRVYLNVHGLWVKA